MWAAMAGANAIDVQRADLARRPKLEMMMEGPPTASGPSTTGRPAPPARTIVKRESDDEDDFDPNSVGAPVAPPQASNVGVKDEDDDDDFDPNSVDASAPPPPPLPPVPTKVEIKPALEKKRNPMDLDSDDTDAEEFGWD
jgi:hypothetical protein